MNDESQDFVD